MSRCGLSRLVGHEVAAVERAAGADTIRQRRRRTHRQRTAHAVARRADLFLLVDCRLAVEPRYESLGVGHVGLGGKSPASFISASRVAGSWKFGFSGAVGAFCTR